MALFRSMSRHAGIQEGTLAELKNGTEEYNTQAVILKRLQIVCAAIKLARAKFTTAGAEKIAVEYLKQYRSLELFAAAEPVVPFKFSPPLKLWRCHNIREVELRVPLVRIGVYVFD